MIVPPCSNNDGASRRKAASSPPELNLSHVIRQEEGRRKSLATGFVTNVVGSFTLGNNFLAME